MKSFIKIISGLLLIIIIMSCTKDTDPDEGMIFPLEIGNQWEYLREFYLCNFDPDSLGEGISDTTITNVYQEIVRTDTIFDTLEIEVMYEDYAGFERENYYKNEGDGLYLYGYHNFSSSNNNNIRIKFKGGVFNNIDELLSLLKGIGSYQICERDTTIYDDPPYKTLQYPLEVGDIWTNRILDGEIDQKIEVIGKELIETDAGLFNCFKIQYFIDLDEDGFWDEDLILFQYVCSEGFIKNLYIVENVEFIGNQGEHLGYCDGHEEINLTEYILY